MFAEWMEKYSISFPNASEYARRLQIFIETDNIIEEHNANKESTYTLAHNAFSHMTLSEFESHMGLRASAHSKPGLTSAGPVDTSSNYTVVPSSWDWTSKGAVTDVKDQGKCSSGGWAFSVAAAIESAYQIQGNDLTSLSEQNIISCDTTDTGCDGGWMDSGFSWVKKNGGLCTSTAYPYSSGDTGSSGECSTSCSSLKGTAPTSYTDVTQGSVSALTSAVYQQPVSVAIQANQIGIKSYGSGVFSGKCGQRVDHGVLVVGYGTDPDSGLDYWKIKNSWGTSWGEQGYLRIEKSDADRCGVLDAPSYPNLS
eukprot:CAMPEP_0185026086 /NCGR_PEP_ID=MMETSP1103-20130426/9853_1 /TAXON_ID=36769 /ORGANISM="Paraphysomonas bandaiensis, Strain Caron Lab Isolate" /LENGTH=310 /DNA_ID=CAMNT_0027559545 /DNA_START=155 /DNA_END=1087 /DNA_ORIENTATION=+